MIIAENVFVCLFTFLVCATDIHRFVDTDIPNAERSNAQTTERHLVN